MNHIDRKRAIPVKFCDLPQHPIDKSLFDQNTYTSLSERGLHISPLGLIHAASLHYYGKFPGSIQQRLENAFIDIFHNVADDPNDGLFILDSETAEFQTKSTEVIAAGLCVETISRLFDVSHNRISPIHTTKKRCDFKFILNGRSYVVESKGRKGRTSAAIADIFRKKAQYPSDIPKYGIISNIPRDGGSVSIDVIDPDYEPRIVPRYQLTRLLLYHYARLSYLAGFWKMGDLLLKRVSSLTSDAVMVEMDGAKLQFRDILKQGYSLGFRIGSSEYEFFIPRGRPGFRHTIDAYTSIFAMDLNIFNLLDGQQFEKIEQYYFTAQPFSLDTSVPLSAANDGSILALMPTEKLAQYL